MNRPQNPPPRTTRLAAALLALSAFTLAPGSVMRTAAQTLETSGGGAKNVVFARGRTDGQFEFSGAVQLNRIPAPRVAPLNLASASASCQDCQTFAVALQLNLIPRDAPWITPENSASAVNYNCIRCYTMARAIQYVIQVDDPAVVPPDVAALAREMDLEFARLQAHGAPNLSEAQARIDSVVVRFAGLAATYISDQTQSAPLPTDPTPEPTFTPAPTSTASVTPISIPEVTPEATPVPASTPTPGPVLSS